MEMAESCASQVCHLTVWPLLELANGTGVFADVKTAWVHTQFGVFASRGNHCGMLVIERRLDRRWNLGVLTEGVGSTSCRCQVSQIDVASHRRTNCPGDFGLLWIWGLKAPWTDCWLSQCRAGLKSSSGEAAMKGFRPLPHCGEQRPACLVWWSRQSGFGASYPQGLWRELGNSLICCTFLAFVSSEMGRGLEPPHPLRHT